MKKVFDSQQLKAEIPGRIKRDERGNSCFEWSREDLTAETQEAQQLRMDALHHPDLSVDDPTKRADVRTGDPYNTGPIENKPKRKKVDLRELSKWIEAQKQAKSGSSK